MTSIVVGIYIGLMLEVVREAASNRKSVLTDFKLASMVAWIIVFGIRHHNITSCYVHSSMRVFISGIGEGKAGLQSSLILPTTFCNISGHSRDFTQVEAE